MTWATKTCSKCGTAHDQAGWQSLPLVGLQKVHGVEPMELRNCACGSTLCVNVHQTSWSGLEDFRKSPKLYHARRIARTVPRRADTDALLFGKAFEMALLEPERFATETCFPPRVDRSTRIGRAALLPEVGVVVCPSAKGTKTWKAYQAEHPDAMIITPDEHREIIDLRAELDECKGKVELRVEWMPLIDGMVEAVHANETAAALVTVPGDVQWGFEFRHETGIWVRGKVDKVAGSVAVDVKTVGTKTGDYTDLSPDAFARTVLRFGYHRQDAIYRMGLDAVRRACKHFAFLCVGKEPPHDVAVHQMDGDATDLGMRQVRASLRDLARRLEDDDWRAAYEHQANYVELPPWAFSEAV